MTDDRNAGPEDTTRNERHAQNAAANRDALAAQARRTGATTPPGVSATGAPHQGSDAGTGARYGGAANDMPDQGNEDTSRNEEEVRRAAENRDALAAQARRTEETAPPGTRAGTLPDPHGRDR